MNTAKLQEQLFYRTPPMAASVTNISLFAFGKTGFIQIHIKIDNSDNLTTLT